MLERLEDKPASEELVQEVAKSTVPVFHYELVDVLKEDYLRLMGRASKVSTQETLADAISRTVSDFLADRLRQRVVFKDRMN